MLFSPSVKEEEVESREEYFLISQESLYRLIFFSSNLIY